MKETPDPALAMHLYVWQDRFLYVGPSKATTLHRNHAAVWLAAPGGTLRVTLADGSQLENEAVYLPSGTEYATADAHTAIAAFFWEPESASFLRLAAKFTDEPRAFRCQFASPATCAQLQKHATTLAEADQLLAPMLGAAAIDFPPPAPMDARVLAALAFLRESPQHYGSLETLAEKVHLSPSRLAHIFKQEIGVPVRRYVLWNKMRRALDFAIAGDSLTTAALSAGFADSAHLSRTVRSMMGIAPEFLFRHRERLVIHH